MNFSARTLRWGIVITSSLLTVAGSWAYLLAVNHDQQITLAEWAGVPLFAVLFGWLSFSFSTASAGFVTQLRSNQLLAKQDLQAASDIYPKVLDASRRTAILMPVYNESPVSVMAGLRAMFESLESTGQGNRFDFFILSDTNRPDVWLLEERLWRALRDDLIDQNPHSECQVFYRHRSRNVARKSGNISEFCCKWGDYYDYMIVLDADSLVEGDVMVEMVHRMEADDRLGIFQVPPVPIGRSSLFARLQQFAADVYGPMFCRGFSGWTADKANYFGHNAILRIEAFMAHCELPRLQGEPPFGGEILSHDFVEAALMLKAGYKVKVDCELIGSYEECPTTIEDFAQRDQRWCQGNLQHTRLIAADGFLSFSRIHFLTGVMSYCSSPIWLLFAAVTLVAGIAGGTSLVEGSNHWAAILFGVTMTLLFAPKFLSVIAMIPRREEFRKRGGAGKLVCSVVLEAVASTLLAPIMAAYHTRFVIAAIRGRSVQWTAQQRSESSVTWRQAARNHLGITAFAFGIMALLLATAPTMLLWFTPLLLGMWLAIPIAVVMGSESFGRALQTAGILVTTAEQTPPHVQRRRDQIQCDLMQQQANSLPESLFCCVLTDVAYLDQHLEMLESSQTKLTLTGDQRDKIGLISSFADLSNMDDDLQFAVLADPDALRALSRLVSA